MNNRCVLGFVVGFLCWEGDELVVRILVGVSFFSYGGGFLGKGDLFRIGFIV